MTALPHFGTSRRLPFPDLTMDGAAAEEADLQRAVRSLLDELGEDPDRPGLVDTPARVARSLRALTAGYQANPKDVVGTALFAERHRSVVVVRDIEFYSLCEHHLLPFFGRVHIGYVPDVKVVGLSKLPRLVDVYARRLQVQERMTEDIADAIEEVLAPQGVAVLVEATHLCMMMRGVAKQQSETSTTTLRGVLETDPVQREQFMRMAQPPR